MKLFLGTNVLTEVSGYSYANHMGMYFRLGRNFPNLEVRAFPPRRMSIDNMRNAAAKSALDWEADYLMFLDDDVIIDPFKTFDSLLDACENHGADIVMAHTYIRGYPFEPMFFKHSTEDKKLTPYRDWKDNIDENGLVWCDAVGFSCVLIKCELLKKVAQPYFVTGVLGTEDVYFCMQARKQLGEKNVKICVDTKVPTGHILDPEVISAENRDSLLKYYEEVYQFKTDAESPDRGTKYAKEVKSSFKKKKTVFEPRLRAK